MKRPTTRAGIAMALLLCLASWSCQEAERPNSDPEASTDAIGTPPTPADQRPQPGKPKPVAQPKKSSKPRTRRQDPEDLLTYPRDAERVMATVNNRTIKLREIIDHIDAHHFPGFAALSKTKAGQLELRTPRMADWTRQFADVVALRTEARERKIDAAKIKKDRIAAYTEAFARFRTDYERMTKRPFPAKPDTFQFLRNDFQKKNGLSVEVDGLLNTLVPDELDRRGVVAFYNDHHQAMTGFLAISQIFIRNRDKRTGALFTGARRKKVEESIRTIRGLLKPDGSNFETIAAEQSEDRRAASRGGLLDNLHRFDPRMPANICRTAWSLKDGQWTGPLETRFGVHFIKRVRWTITKHIINPDHKNKDVRRFVRSHRKELVLFALRKKHDVRLQYCSGATRVVLPRETHNGPPEVERPERYAAPRSRSTLRA